MQIEIHDLNSQTAYIANSVEECKDSTDKEVFQMVEQFNDVITMGKVIGRPVNPEKIESLSQIRAVAAPWFKDNAVESVEVQAVWGLVTVHRNGDVFAK